MVTVPSFEDIAKAHGHTCPGIAVGYKISKAAAVWAGDEDDISVYSTSTKCPLDALRTVFHLREHPDRLVVEDRHELHFILTKPDGSKLYIDEVPGSKIFNPEADALKEKMHAGTATQEEIARFDVLQKELLQKTFDTPDEKLFTLRTA
ncbi:MAG TPA: FmdE family protein [Methanocorpusculum sp.]|nr:FmdE family protein [Methanocorpusculum sp.]